MMESERWCSSSEYDFGFAFNDSKFSDRVLRIEIMADPVDTPPPPVIRVKTLHISSPILAAKSPFFYKLFSNGMRESEQKHVTLIIYASEEAALMELLNFMYTNTLNITAAPALLDLLMAADKFGVSSCITYCIRLLLNTPMTRDSALLYLELLPHIDAVQPLIDVAKQYLADRYKDITKFKEELMAFPLSAIEAIFASDDLLVTSEDDVCNFVVKWARQHYNNLEERQEVMGTRLARLIHFHHMTHKKLKNVLACIDFYHKDAYKLALEAIFSKAEAEEERRRRLVERSLY